MYGRAIANQLNDAQIIDEAQHQDAGADGDKRDRVAQPVAPAVVAAAEITDRVASNFVLQTWTKSTLTLDHARFKFTVKKRRGGVKGLATIHARIHQSKDKSDSAAAEAAQHNANAASSRIEWHTKTIGMQSLDATALSSTEKLCENKSSKHW